MWLNIHKGVHTMLCNSASKPEIGLLGRMSAGLQSGTPQNRPSGRPSAGRRADFDVCPTRIRPKSGREARFPARKHYCVTLGRWVLSEKHCQARSRNALSIRLRGSHRAGIGPARPENDRASTISGPTPSTPRSSCQTDYRLE